MKTEVLAPVGNIDALKSAVYYGADAVYFGLSEFNARMKADNFNLDNLSEWVDFCHLHGVKVYITLNTLVKNSELNKLAHFIYQATTCNVDAFIVADIATITLCKKICSFIPLHFSTQFGVHNLEGAIRAKKLGASRVILSRETPLDEIKRIIKNAGIEVEVFVHGAMCVSFSGNCYLSSFIDGNSGNRGRCKQPCRLKYCSSLSKKDEYYLSMKDLCLIDRVKELSDLGVASVKIEGRLKSAEYVASTVVAYKNALNGVLAKKDVQNMQSTYSRVATTKGYLDGEKYDIISSDIQNNVGLTIGKTVKSEKLKNGLNKITFSSNKVLSKGDGIKITYNGKEICGAELSSSVKEKEGYVVYVSKNAPIGSTVSLTFNSNILNELPQKRLNVKFDLKEIEVAKYCLNVVDENGTTASVEFCSDKNTVRQNADGKTSARNVLSKGLDPFVVSDIKVEFSSNTFLPNSILNNARKECRDLLAEQILEKYKKSSPVKFDNLLIDNTNEIKIENRVAVIIDKFDDLTSEVLSVADDLIYMPNDYNNLDDRVFEFGKIKKLYLGLPVVSFEKDIKVFYKTIHSYNTLLSGIYGNGQYCVEIAKKFNLEIFAGVGLNIFNHLSSNEYDKFVYSIELNKNEILSSNRLGYIYAYGSPELMSFAHCPNYANKNNCANCSFDKGDIRYSNKMDELVIKRIKIHNCYFTMHDNKKICLFDLLNNKDCNILLDLRFCDDINGVIDCYNKSLSIPDTTYGHYLKGVL